MDLPPRSDGLHDPNEPATPDSEIRAYDMSGNSKTEFERGVNPLELGAEKLLLQDSRSYWEAIWDDVRKRPTAVVAIWLLTALAFVAVFAPLIANHRPYVAVTPVAGDDIPVGTTELSYPLFRSLSIVDWSLMSAYIAAVWIIMWRRSLQQRGGKSHPLALLLYLAFSVLPIVGGLLAVPWERRATIGLPAWWWWTCFGTLAGMGIIGLAYGVSVLAIGRRDAFGRDMTGSALRAAYLGTLMCAIGGSAFGTLSRPKLDATDYYKKYVMEPEQGAWALFPPIPHNFLASENYARKQGPLSPKLRFIDSSGSDVASVLCLDDKSRENGITLLDRITAGTLTLETPLTDLGEKTDGGFIDSGRGRLIVVTRNLNPTRVTFRDVKTIGDVVQQLNDAGTKVNRRTQEKEISYLVTLDAAKGLVFQDLTIPRPVHWLGTEDSGADVASRIIMATRVALSIGFVSTGIAVIIGVVFGAIIGYFGGWVDFVGMRIIEIFMAIPRLFLLLTIIAFLPPEWGPYMLYAMMIVIGLTSWMASARFIRAEFFRLRESDYVQAAKACGLPLRSILFKHMLPNGVAPVLVSASFGVAAAIFVETGLSFLGFGIKPPNPSWGQMLNEAVDPDIGVFYWWLAIFPGILIFVTVFSFNLIGDALRDAIDPKLKKASAV